MSKPLMHKQIQRINRLSLLVTIGVVVLFAHNARINQLAMELANIKRAEGE